MDIRYFAGFFDGEGSLGMHEAKYPRAEVSNTHKAVLMAFQKRFEGHIYRASGSLNSAPIWIWILEEAKKMREFLLCITPHLCQKAAAAEVCLWALDQFPEEREEAALLIRRLNQKGRLANKPQARLDAKVLVSR